LVVSIKLLIFAIHQTTKAMQKDTEITDVMFRFDTKTDFNDKVFAVMPHEVNDHKGGVTTYQHVGQHSTGDYNAMLSYSRPATELEYTDLKAELESIGYNLKIVKRRNYYKYLISYKKR